MSNIYNDKMNEVIVALGATPDPAPAGNIYVARLEEIRDAAISLASRVASGGGYTHTQAVADNQWTIVHSLNRSPGIFVTDTGGNIIEFDRQDPDFNTSILTFSSATAGKAVCS